MTYFLDASALVKRYVREAASDRVRSLIKRGARLVVSRLTAVEVPAAIWRRCRAGDVATGDARNLIARFTSDIGQLTIIEPRATTLDLAVELVGRYPLRAYDAVQLASALRWTRETGLAGCFVSADRGLAAAAAAQKLRRMTLD